ncbi:MAG: porin [Spirochaetota bacterium]|nr:porin [Spirochaetota bacterium]
MLRISRYIVTLMVTMSLAMPLLAEDKRITRLTFGENRWISVHYLLQVQGYTQNTYFPQSGENESDDAIWSKNFIVRRSRIILEGQVARDVTFFMQTDDFRIGEYDNDSDGENKAFTQDAYINYRAADELQIAAGMISVPFMHHNRQYSAHLLGVDYNEEVIPLRGITNVWRDTGVEVRGLLLDTLNGKKGLIDYRIGIWQGVSKNYNYTEDTASDDINPYDYPRYCGRIQINLMDPETGFYYSGNYLGEKRIISLGAGFDYQNHAFRDYDFNTGGYGGLQAYRAWTVDAVIDYDLGEGMALAIQGAFIDVKNRPYYSFSAHDQYGFFGQIGFLFNGNIQLVCKYLSWTYEDWGDVSGDYERAYAIGGVNYFIDGHNANLKIEYQNPLNNDHKASSGEKKGTIQFQIYI